MSDNLVVTTQATVYISKTDRDRLGNLIELVRKHGAPSDVSYVNKLEDELEFAEVLAPQNIPPDVVTMRSKVSLLDLDTGEESSYSIVFPTEANLDEGKISVLTPLATALLGHRRGATVEFKAPGRIRRLRILDIPFQPEADGFFDL
ncbi:MAG: GreA/GreB family elongation factor [Pyrinomonadaceae bacterium]